MRGVCDGRRSGGSSCRCLPPVTATSPRLQTRRPLPGRRSDHHALNRVQDARCARGAGRGATRTGVDGREEFHVMPTADRTPPLSRLPADVGDRSEGCRDAGRRAAQGAWLPGGPVAPFGVRPVRGLRRLGCRCLTSPTGSPAASRTAWRPWCRGPARSQSGTTHDRPVWSRSATVFSVIVDGLVIADTTRALRVLKTAGAPVYYVPDEDVLMHRLRPSSSTSHCEWKGDATYWTLESGGPRIRDLAWSYEHPEPRLRGDPRPPRLLRREGRRGVGWRRTGDAATGRVLRRLDDVADRGAREG